MALLEHPAVFLVCIASHIDLNFIALSVSLDEPYILSLVETSGVSFSYHVKIRMKPNVSVGQSS